MDLELTVVERIMVKLSDAAGRGRLPIWAAKLVERVLDIRIKRAYKVK